MSTVTYGYLELPYLTEPYATAVVNESYGNQITFAVNASNQIRSQFTAQIANFPNAIKNQLEARIIASDSIRSQIDQKIDASAIVRSQLLLATTASSAFLSQFSRIIASPINVLRTQMSRGPVVHQICGGYLVDSYLSMPYLVAEICAHMYSQISFMLNKTTTIKSQFNRQIAATTVVRSQYQRAILSSAAIKAQFNRVASYKMYSQMLFALYNTTNLRILNNFPSRGTSGTNWTVVSGGTATGSFSVNNLNSDIVEQVYRSTATSFVIQCDTQISQGVFLDTLAILGHNFTKSATVLLQGSNDITFSSIPFTETLSIESPNIYFISPLLPTASYRYWRFDVNDFTNTNAYLQMGTIVFGSSIIFNGECFIDEVVRRKIHFSDRIKTEAFSNVSNDRALKYAVQLRFQRLNYGKSNYANLVEVVDSVRTSLKALWIPTPQFPSRFGVFGKLTEIPVENHKVISASADYIDLDINVDESL